MVWLALMLSAAAPISACTCGPSARAPVCESYYAYEAVFLGTVVERDFDGWTMHLVKVDEGFRGLVGGQREVLVDGGSACGATYEVGKQYLFFADDGGNRKSARGLKVLSSPMCYPSRLASQVPDRIAWLRSLKAGVRSKERVYGMTMQNFSDILPPSKDWDLPMAAVRLRLIGEAGRFETISGPDGAFSFESMPPGKYTLRAERTPWIPSVMAVNLGPGGCALRYPSLRSEGELSGTVIDHLGKPAQGVTVELARPLANGRLAPIPLANRRTDSFGWFHLDYLPAGDFVLGVNLTRPPAREPYPVTGRTISLQPHQKLGALRLQLPPPRDWKRRR